MKHAVLILTTLLIATSAAADDGKPPSTGLSVFVNAAGYSAAANAAEFYGGYDFNPNKINNILKSDLYGRAIWDHLVDAGYLSPSAVGQYDQLTVVEFPPKMEYRLAYQIGLGLRYDYASGFGWLLRFDMAKLQAVGGFNLSTGGIPLLGTDQYITCGIFGKENRYNIDLALAKTVALSNMLDLELNLGAGLVNVKVDENAMEIAGATYSILDRTDGEIPSTYTAEYDYQNQGRIGYGVFATIATGYRVSGIGALKLFYTCRHDRITFYDREAHGNRKVWGWQHAFGIRIEMNNFSFL
jgi:hypothetical protein